MVMARRHQRGWLKKEVRSQGETWVLYFRTVRKLDGKRANATKCCLEETGSAWRANTGEKCVFSRFVLAFGAAECAAMQTVHLAASDALE